MSQEPRTYCDHTLEELKELAPEVEYIDEGLQVTGVLHRVATLMLFGAVVPKLVERIEELEAQVNNHT